MAQTRTDKPGWRTQASCHMCMTIYVLSSAFLKDNSLEKCNEMLKGQHKITRLLIFLKEAFSGERHGRQKAWSSPAKQTTASADLMHMSEMAVQPV